MGVLGGVRTDDVAMCWGYNHEIGPFACWDALGVKETAEYLESLGESLPEIVKDVLELGTGSFYKTEGGKKLAWSSLEKKYIPIPKRPGEFNLEYKKTLGLKVDGNECASLIGLEDDILFIELHGKKNAFSIKMVDTVTQAILDAQGKYQAAVIGTQLDTFSVGADLTEMIGAAQSGDLKTMNQAIANFQNMSIVTLRMFM